MGIPMIFSWLSRKYEGVVESHAGPRSECVDNLYVDMNGIIHPCAHPSGRPAPRNENEIFDAIFSYLDRIVSIVKPKRLLYLAVDGVAPRAKMNQQRVRRLRASIDRKKLASDIQNARSKLESNGVELPETTKIFDSNAITPGTEFMESCSVGDRLKVFLDLDRPEVNELTPWSGMLCGSSLPVLYSSGPVLVLELQTDNIRQNQSTGFRGVFRFIDTSSYKTEGLKLPGTACDYQFINGNHSNSHAKGKFYSPQYPSSYPKNSRCTYRFKAKPRERIRVVFEELNFQKGDVSCLDREDVLKAHDGGVVLAPVVAVLCNEATNFELLSTSNQLYLEFASSSQWPGHGFTATYHFEPVLEMNPDLMAKLADTGPAVSATRSNCDIKISSDVHKQGQIFSPGFPVGYLPSTKCRYEFQATGKERIRIVFTYFKLATKSTKEVAKECNGEDSVTPYIMVDGRWEKLESFCGTDTPKPVLSNGPRLVLEFASFNSSKGSGGFRAEYKFVKDFSVRSGKQLSEYPCAFRYTWQEAMSGNIHSPNFPGLYPRDTECHYFFHGAVHQKIKVHFHFFDIEGIHPCDTATDSDYVEFFNFMTKDETKMYTRHCGQLDPFDIVVDRRFFRVTFRSNDRLDGLGFNATYHFIDVKHPRKFLPPAVADDTATSSVSDLFLVIAAACLLLR